MCEHEWEAEYIYYKKRNLFGFKSHKYYEFHICNKCNSLLVARGVPDEIVKEMAKEIKRIVKC